MKEYEEFLTSSIIDKSKRLSTALDDWSHAIWNSSKDFRRFATYLSRSSAHPWKMQNKNGRNKHERRRDQVKLRGHRRNRRK